MIPVAAKPQKAGGPQPYRSMPIADFDGRKENGKQT
jgi:hypothetical protein